MKPIKAILVGAGGRGMMSYGKYAISHPHEIKFIAVAEPDTERRNKFRKMHNLSEEMCFSDWKEILDKPRFADAVLVCSQDRMHFKPAMAALEKDYHVLMEKPMSPVPQECIIMGDYAKQKNRIFMICHTMRYSEFMPAIKKLVDEGRIGRLISIEQKENVAFWHYVHSFVRGPWRNSKQTSFMLLQKSCHDMDSIRWITGADCTRISSFGKLTHFKKKNAPEGAPKMCIEGCPAETKCPFYAPRLYLEGKKFGSWRLSFDKSMEARTEALRKSPFGRCVYQCDNDVVDHQVVSMEFENEVTAVFTMCTFDEESKRTIKLFGTKGVIRGDKFKNEIEVTDILTRRKEIIKLKNSDYGHGGGDFWIMHDFINLVQEDGIKQSLTSARVSVHSHLMAFAAEKSRLESRLIDMKEYEKEIRSTL